MALHESQLSSPAPTSVATPIALSSRLRVYVPNAITVSRILLIPVFVLLFLDPTPGRSEAAAIVFAVAALTDAIDGYLARRWGHVTNVGKLLDPIADKLLVLTALFLLVDFDRVAAWVAIVLAGREFFVTGLRGVAAREGVVFAAETVGKYKMVAQVVAILCLILENTDLVVMNLHTLGFTILMVSMVLSLVSAAQYCQQFAKHVLPKWKLGGGLP